MSLSSELWQANTDLARTCLAHPFVQGIADGSLSKERFSYYVGQDVFFLKAFARAYSVGAAKAPDWEGFCNLHTLADGVLEELKLHDKYAARWNVDIIQVEPGRATRRYTDFLLATSWANDTGITVAAMSPCMRLYAYLGQELAALNPSEHQYIDWILTYSSQNIVMLAKQLEQLVDRYVSDKGLAHTTYRYAMECELEFFQAAFDRC